MVRTLYLTISFRVIRGKHIQSCFERMVDGMTILRREPRVHVRDELTG